VRREQYHAPHHVTTYEAFVHPAWVPELTADTDRPLVAGAVYNGTHTTPYALPEEKTESTRKSASSLGSNGFNEVRIEDAAGEEEVFIHSQKDEDLLTENDKDQRVRGYEDLLVKKDRKRMVEGDQELRVEMDDVGVVEGNQTLLVQKNRDTTTKGSHDESVEGNQAMTVGKHLTSFVSQGAMENVALAKATTIGGAYSVNVALAYNEATGGARAVEIGAAHSELVEAMGREGPDAAEGAGVAAGAGDARRPRVGIALDDEECAEARGLRCRRRGTQSVRTASPDDCMNLATAFRRRERKRKGRTPRSETSNSATSADRRENSRPVGSPWCPWTPRRRSWWATSRMADRSGTPAARPPGRMCMTFRTWRRARRFPMGCTT